MDIAGSADGPVTDRMDTSGGVEGPAAALQRLQERVAQLQAENERLSNVQRHTAGEGGSQSSRREQALYLPRERRCPKFSGSTAAGSLSVEEWIEEAESCIRLRYMSELDKALFLYDHLEGQARNEIKYRSSAVRESHEQIITVLKEVYGCSKSYVYWQQRFFDRKQRESESLFEFSHALMELMEKVKQSKEGSITNSDIVLRDQFCENVRDHMLRRELKRLVRADEGLTLLDIRREATRWVEEGQSTRDRCSRAPERASETVYATQCESTLAQTSEISELKEMVLKQQAQLDLLVKHLGQPTSKPPAFQPYKPGRFKRTSDGQPICIKCDQPGHIARFCQSVPPPRNSRPVSQLLNEGPNSNSAPLASGPASQLGN